MGDFAEFLEKSKKVVALDFDGVIHNDSKGFFDGTIYGEPMEGTETALKYLSDNYKIVIFSCKSNPNRPLINDKTGTQLIWDWLESYNFKQYISDVVWGKPNAFVYVDDKGFTFKNWTDTLEHIKYIK
jgi:histidinol phosphatase-like enzyme